MLRTTLATAAITLAAGAASAVTVDNFTVTGTTGAVIGAGPVSGSFTDAGGIGTSRTVTATIESTIMGSAEAKADSNDLNVARFEFETSSTAKGLVSLSYSGLGGVDLTSNLLRIVDVVNDSAFSLNIEITSGGSTDDDDFTIGTFNIMETLTFDLSGIAGADSVDDIVFTFDAVTHGGDISFAEISQVPVPAAGVLLAGALGGMVVLRRRKAA